MGIHFLEIPNSKHIYVCKVCDTPLAKRRDVQSENFFGRAGPAYLLRKAYNLKHGDPENRDMRTGLHTVRDVYCKVCFTYRRRRAKLMGWYYEFAFDDSQRYKEGRIILEKRLLKEVTAIDEQNPVYKPGNSGRPAQNTPENPDNTDNHGNDTYDNQEENQTDSSNNSEDSSDSDEDDDDDLNESSLNIRERALPSLTTRTSTRPTLISASRLVMPWERDLSSDDIHNRNFIRFGVLRDDNDSDRIRPEQTIRIFEGAVRRRHQGGDIEN